MSYALPDQINKYFWGDDLTELEWPKHKKYIIQTLLDKGNTDALQWLFSRTNREEVKRLLPSLRLSSKSDNFWRIYLS